jgi:DNA replication protein DnaC
MAELTEAEVMRRHAQRKKEVREAKGATADTPKAAEQPVCPGCGERPAEVLEAVGRRLVVRCAECRKAEQASTVVVWSDPAAERASQIRSVLAEAGVNVRRYVDREPVSLDTFDPEPDAEALGAARRFVAEYRKGGRPSLYLFGRRDGDALAAGNGKTHLAVAMLRELALDPDIRPSELRFVFVPELLLEIQDTFDNPQRSMLDVVRRYEAPELLVWDDLGAEQLTSFAVRTLYTLLYKREGRSNVFTSNLDLDQLVARDPYAERIVSRILGDCELVRLRGPDRREMRALARSREEA